MKHEQTTMWFCIVALVENVTVDTALIEITAKRDLKQPMDFIELRILRSYLCTQNGTDFGSF